VPWKLLLTIGACLAATLLTPLGLAFWTEIATSMARSRANQIAEWLPPEWPPAHLAFWTAAVALPVMAVMRRRWLATAERWTLVLGALLFLPLALQSMRNISPFLMVAAPAVGVLLTRPGHVEPRRSSEPLGRVRRVIIWCAAVGAAAIVWQVWRQPPARMGWMPISSAAAEAIEECPGHLYNRYIDGGPIIYFAPGQPVLLDSRQDPFPVELVQAQRHVELTGEYERLFAQYAINCAALPPASLTRRRLDQDGWIRRYDDGQWVVLERPSAGDTSSSGGGGMK
jgi:hypothetical protein